MKEQPRAAVLTALGPLLRRAERAYLAGPTLDEAVAVGRRLQARGHRITLAYWHAEGEDPAAVTEQTRRAVARLVELDGGGHVAVKAPGLGFDAGSVRSLAAGAGEVRLVFDAHGPGDADRTIELASLAGAVGRAGVALPVRWARSATDAETALEAGLSVRLVKGQFPDPGQPSRPREAALRAAYLALVDRLAGRAPVVQIATHDHLLVEEAVRRLLTAGSRCEVELLLGLPAARTLEVTARQGVPVRFYLPYGSPSLVYSPGAVLARPRLAATLAQGVLLGGRNQRLREREALRRRTGTAVG